MNKRFDPLPPRLIFWGGTGQAKVVRPITDAQGARLVAVFDDTPGLPPPFPDVPVFQGRRDFPGWIESQRRDDLGFVIAIANPHGRVRLQLADLMVGHGLREASVVHPTAWVEDNAHVGPGAQIMAGAIVMAQARVGRQCILNTKSSLDHESVLGDGGELGPGATLCGCITCDTNVWIAAGATVLPRVRLGADAVVGAGSLVRRDVPPGAVVVGVPARPIVRSDPSTAKPRPNV